ncbi:hypothetical protein KC973_01730 [Candidatus Saccharibacteria bacterium]|nr:hypothetical protein [Candidatus Saccharibacteria bacterium]
MRRINISGMTITELLVTCVVVSIMSVVIVDFLGNWTKQHAISETRSTLLAEAQTALDTVTDAVRLSAAADQNNRWEDDNAPDAPSDLLSWASNADTLVLASAVEDTSGNIIFSDPLNYTSQKNNQIFFVNNGVLYRRILAAPEGDNALATSCPESAATASCPADRNLAESVTNFSVKYYDGSNQEVIPTDARSVELSITLGTTKYDQQISETYSTRMVFRND